MRTQLALVTGATSGIGAAVARTLAASGMGVLLVGRSATRLAAAARQLPARSRAGTLLADLSSPDAVKGILQTVAAVSRRLDLLVHCAGEYHWSPPGSLDTTHLDRMFAINVRAPYLLTQGLTPLLARARGQVIIVNSSVVRNPGQGIAGYKAMQHAVQGFTDSVRQDLNTHGIRVTSLFPGRTATPRMRRISVHEGKPYRPGKLLKPADIAQLVLALTRLPHRLEVTDLQLRSATPY